MQDKYQPWPFVWPFGGKPGIIGTIKGLCRKQFFEMKEHTHYEKSIE